MIKDSYFHKATNVKTWTLLNTAQKMVIPLGAMGILAGLLVLCGYVLDVESLYRPIEGGAATNPITAILFILLGYSLVSPKKYQLGRLISALLIMLITVVRILSFVFQNELYAYFMPFQNIVFFEQSQGKSNNLGINSAVMFFLLSCSIVAYYFKAFRLSQFIAFFSINIPLISIIGYAYDVDNIYGQMSLYTTSFGLILSVSTLLLTANKLLMNGLLSPYKGGKLARTQVLLSFLFCLLVGYLIVKTLFESGEGNWFGAFIVAVSWFIFMLIGTSAYYQEIIDRAHRNKEHQLTIAALSDSLTGLPNRRMFFDYCTREFERIKRSGDEIFLMLIDVDDFKKINDSAGHQTGDIVLKEIGSVLISTVRSVDIAARVGGEEFAVLLTDTNKEGVARVALQIKEEISKITVDDFLVEHGEVTVSIGGASSVLYHNVDSAFKAADDAMYYSKRNGKNQFTLSSDMHK